MNLIAKVAYLVPASNW